MTYVRGELCGFIDYNMEYVMFIMTYITLTLQIDIFYDIYYVIIKLMSNFNVSIICATTTHLFY
jgi:hypothetical protein